MHFPAAPKGAEGNMKIFIDPGHGGPDPGAVGNGVIEEYANLNVSLELQRN